MTAPAPNRGWIVSPAFDLLFLANLGWLLLLLPGFASRTDTAIDFWQIYFLTLPHRWITLVLVAADPDRRENRARKLIVVAALFAVLVVGAVVGTGAFLCLALIDYVWNAWHFGSQHAGVLRMYTRKVGGGFDLLERWGLRLFVVYGALRAAEWAVGWFETDPTARAAFAVADFAVLIIPTALLLTNFIGASRERVGKLAYLASVCGLYTGFVLSLHFRWTGLIVVFAVAASLFHAVEYLAVVTHYARRRESVGSPGRFRALAKSWFLFLAVYVLALGSVGAWMSRPGSELAVVWQGLNLWAAFVHYAFDGMIWKLRRPETAAALGVAGAP